MILSPVELNCPVDRINLIGSHRDTVMRLSVERREKEGATIILYGFMTILRCNMIAPDLFSVNSQDGDAIRSYPKSFLKAIHN